MLIIGVDFHSCFQQIAMVDTESGELIEHRLEHSNGEAQKFYAGLQKPVRAGMEATGYAQSQFHPALRRPSCNCTVRPASWSVSEMGILHQLTLQL